MIDELSNHAIPLPLIVLGTIFAVRDKFDFVRKSKDVGELLQQVQAVTLKAVVPVQRLVRFLIHHVWVFLPEKYISRTI